MAKYRRRLGFNIDENIRQDVSLNGEMRFLYDGTRLQTSHKTHAYQPVSSQPAILTDVEDALWPLPLHVVDIGQRLAPTEVTGGGPAAVNLVARHRGDVWGVGDSLGGVEVITAGDFDFLARLVAFNVSDWAKAGLMVREEAAAISRTVVMQLVHVAPAPASGIGASFTYRPTVGGLMVQEGAAAVTGVPLYLRLTRLGNTFTGRISEDGSAWSLIGTVDLAMPERLKLIQFSAGVQATNALSSAIFDTHRLTGRVGMTAPRRDWLLLDGEATDDYLTNSTVVTLAGGGSDPDLDGHIIAERVPAVDLPWPQGPLVALVNAPTGVSVATPAEGQVTISATTTGDVYGTADTFAGAYQRIAGDFDVRARVASLTHFAYIKVGVMGRESLSPGSRHAFASLMDNTDGTRVPYFFSRPVADGGTDYTTGGVVTLPQYVRLTRAGNTFTGYHSPDGAIWTSYGSVSLPLASNLYVTLVLGATTGNAATVNYDNVEVTGEMRADLPQRPRLTFVGPADAVTDDAGAGETVVDIRALGGGTHTWQNAGTALAPRPATNLTTYSGLLATDDSAGDRTSLRTAGVPTREYNLVTDFNADPTGVLDSTAAFADAIFAGQIIGIDWTFGRRITPRVHVPHGIYRVTSTLYGTGDGNGFIHFVGDGIHQTTIKFEGTGDFFADAYWHPSDPQQTQSFGMVWENLSIQGINPANRGSCFNLIAPITNYSWGRFENLEIREFYGYGIIGSNVQSAQFTNVRFTNCRRGGLWLLGQSVGDQSQQNNSNLLRKIDCDVTTAIPQEATTQDLTFSYPGTFATYPATGYQFTADDVTRLVRIDNHFDQNSDILDGDGAHIYTVIKEVNTATRTLRLSCNIPDTGKGATRTCTVMQGSFAAVLVRNGTEVHYDSGTIQACFTGATYPVFPVAALCCEGHHYENIHIENPGAGLNGASFLMSKVAGMLVTGAGQGNGHGVSFVFEYAKAVTVRNEFLGNETGSVYTADAHTDDIWFRSCRFYSYEQFLITTDLSAGGVSIAEDCYFSYGLVFNKAMIGVTTNAAGGTNLIRNSRFQNDALGAGAASIVHDYNGEPGWNVQNSNGISIGVDATAPESCFHKYLRVVGVGGDPPNLPAVVVSQYVHLSDSEPPGWFVCAFWYRVSNGGVEGYGQSIALQGLGNGGVPFLLDPYHAGENAPADRQAVAFAGGGTLPVGQWRRAQFAVKVGAGVGRSLQLVVSSYTGTGGVEIDYTNFVVYRGRSAQGCWESPVTRECGGWIDSARGVSLKDFGTAGEVPVSDPGYTRLASVAGVPHYSHNGGALTPFGGGGGIGGAVTATNVPYASGANTLADSGMSWSADPTTPGLSLLAGDNPFIVTGAVEGAARLKLQTVGNDFVQIGSLTASDVVLLRGNGEQARWTASGLQIGVPGGGTQNLILASASSANTTSLQAAVTPAETLTYRLPATNPTEGQVLVASAPSGGVVTTSWGTVETGGGSIGGSVTATWVPYASGANTLADSGMAWDPTNKGLTVGQGDFPYIYVQSGGGSVGLFQAVGGALCQLGSASNHDMVLLRNGAEHARLMTSVMRLGEPLSLTKGIQLCSSGGSNTTTLEAAVTPDDTLTYRLPAANPIAGQVLTASGVSGGVVNTSWTTVTTGGGGISGPISASYVPYATGAATVANTGMWWSDDATTPGFILEAGTNPYIVIGNTGLARAKFQTVGADFFQGGTLTNHDYVQLRGNSEQARWTAAGLRLGIPGGGTQNLELASGVSGNTTKLQAADTPASALTYKLPAANPSAGQVLSASAPAGGVVTTSWVNPGGGAWIDPSNQAYESPGATITTGHAIVELDTTAGPATFTLHAPSTAHVLFIKNVSLSTATLDVAGGGLIDGATTHTVLAGEGRIIVADGNFWWVYART